LPLKDKKRPKERIELVSLIDMIFILLVFFLVTSFVIRMPLQERTLFVPTPNNEVGRAQILIQFIDSDTVFWLDETAAAVTERIEQEFGYLSSQRLRDRIFSELINSNTMSIERLKLQLDRLKQRAGDDPFARFFILIRCPNNLPYDRVIDVIGQVSDSNYPNIRYGCTGGTLNEIRSCRRIDTVVEVDPETGQRRKNIRIDF